MKVIYHIGMHSTDEDRALDCLLRNSDLLTSRGVVSPRPGRFRPALRDAMIRLKGMPASQEMQDHILEDITGLDAPERLIFSNDSFLCVPRRAIQGGTLYPLVGERAPWIRNLFPDHPAEFALALRNPATMIPALHARFADQESFDQFRGRISPEDLSWVDMIERFRVAVPDASLTIWCNEDSPLIWPEILAALTGLEDCGNLVGVDDFVSGLMSEEGMNRLGDYLRENPPTGIEHRRRIVSAFLDKYAREEAVEMEIDLPGWTADRIACLTERYEADVARIAGLDGIRFLAP